MTENQKLTLALNALKSISFLHKINHDKWADYGAIANDALEKLGIETGQLS